MKPLLPNGYKIDAQSEISRRVFADKNLEIYALNSNLFLNVLKNKAQILASKREKYQIFDLKIASKKYPAFKSKENYEFKSEILLDKIAKISGFDAVAGMSELKKQLLQDLINPIKHKEKYEKFDLQIPNGVLLYGPPGCGKTFIVQKLAEELNFAFIEVKHSDVSSPYIHGGVGQIASVFESARQKAPAIVFLDEIDGLMPKRSELGAHQSYKLEEINEFLQHLNNAANDGVLVVGATNQHELIDEAILRSGRFDKKFYVPPPDFEARVSLFEMYLANRPLQSVDFKDLADITTNYSCSDIKLICDDAARSAVAQELNYITQPLIKQIISQTKSSINLKF